MKGVYDVSPGLRPFGTDFGNGQQDQEHFPRDEDFPRFLANKQRCLAEHPARHLLEHELSPEARLAAATVISEHTGVPSRALIVLGMQVQEDLAIVQTDGERDWLAWMFVCSPSHWRPEAKIGKSFFAVHEPIPGFEKVNAAAAGMVKAMVEKGPWVRFVWGIETCDDLNLHPDHAEPRDFSKPVYVRTERQITWPLPEAKAALFSIRVGVRPAADLSREERLALTQSIESMDEAALAYKGMAGNREAVLRHILES